MSNLPYNSFNNYLKQRFQTTVWRVTIEGGFDCPNRDGKRAFGGCTFCTADGSSSRAQSEEDPIHIQLSTGIEKQRKRHKANKFISYLQSFTNTYATLHRLKQVYNAAIDHPDVVMLSIGTRPDCLEDDVIDLIESYNDKLEVWVDLGLQSIHNSTLDLINRGHSSEEFFDAVHRLKKRAPRTKICAHMIAGLPDEDNDSNLTKSFETGKALAGLPIDGIKIHNLCILKGTKLAYDYEKGLIKPLEMDTYIDLVIKILAILPPEVTVHRLMGEAPGKDELVAPAWANNKDLFLDVLRRKMLQNNVYQGCSLREQVLI
ncbi:MAG: TIGR01212 family radical SAM protein [Candidatus Caenarcaniphilales bacterium]|nr:TIGR01212 family radical SAM protein [Candidatus Caenarcaniphilales bacterium]